jgi:hypothetical protein
MVLEGSHTTWDILSVYAISLLANVILYSLIGLLTWPVIRFVVRGRAQTHE